MASTPFVLGQHIVEHGKDAFLHLAGVAGSPIRMICLVKSIMAKLAERTLSVAGSAWNPGAFTMSQSLLMVLISSAVGRREHVVTEHIAPGEFVDDPDVQSVFRIGAGIGITHPDIFIGQVCHDLVVQVIEGGIVGRNIEVVPVHRVFGFRILHRVLVFGRTAFEFSGIHHECSESAISAIPC